MVQHTCYARIDTNLLPLNPLYGTLTNLKQMMTELNIPRRLVQISYDTCNLYPSIPIDETLEITLRELRDESLKERTNWKTYHIVKNCAKFASKPTLWIMKDKFGLKLMELL